MIVDLISNAQQERCFSLASDSLNDIMLLRIFHLRVFYILEDFLIDPGSDHKIFQQFLRSLICRIINFREINSRHFYSTTFLISVSYNGTL